MKNRRRERGSVMLMAVLVAALLAAVVMGRLQVSTEEIQLMQNHIRGAEALATAEAGLNDALARMRQDAGWSRGFAGKPFEGGFYTVVVDGSTLRSTGVTEHGFMATVEAHVTARPHSGPAGRGDGAPDSIRIDTWRINP